MNPDRRSVLQAGAALAAAGIASGCARIAPRFAVADLPDEIESPRINASPAYRVLHRAGFGPVPGQVQEVESQGIEAYLADQLEPTDQDHPALMAALYGIEPLRMDAAELRDQAEHEVLRALQQAAILRAVYSRWQLRERLADFWSNHFNVYGKKGYGAYRKATDETQVIRKHAFGRFSDMLYASATSPAMLAYLDNQLNTEAGPNENYARELMELHTLGVDGGYTQRDVREVARCFSGWTFETRYLRPRGKFRFDAERHDKGEKLVLGHRIPAGGGIEDGQRVLQILSEHPATARFLSGKLCRYFLGTDQSPAQARVEQAFKESKGDLRHTVKTVLAQKELVDGPPIVKRPFDLLVSALRGLNATTDGDAPLQRHLELMGQPLYLWPMPDGYPDAAESWTGSLLGRWNFAAALAGGQIARTSVPMDALLDRSSGTAFDTAASLLLGRAAPEPWPRVASAADAFAVVLASPEFQWR